ncbi:hypothetical protein HanXRQr2_Chr03g0127861 [Helianthus annuus]|uniref:Uncharacterized protein n=1 Tax=Helianthus annuus TaxID=4232 RepID=A0A9K3JII3_HELAN|nr:hypothetical protein HanXRQr2_Chr03g0127861 [Helianthus annuus]KAJ0945140.1 hypothetical protein HanPSC8_Chr03g0124711 [Helianthus annuus]
MNSIFSSFNALSTGSSGQSLNFNTKYPLAAAAGTTIQDGQKKVKHEAEGSTAVPPSKGGFSARWAPEFDGLHCFESLVC